MLNNQGREWIKTSLQRQPSPLGCQVADILGVAWAGIYHLEHKALGKVKWEDQGLVSIIVRGELATFDYDRLTRLVILCFDASLRMGVEGKGPGYLKLTFWRPLPNNSPTKWRTLDDVIRGVRAGYVQEAV